MLSCQQATCLTCEALDRKLRWRERLELWLHLAICYGCRRFMRQQQQLHQAFQVLREHPEHLPLLGNVRQDQTQKNELPTHKST